MDAEPNLTSSLLWKIWLGSAGHAHFAPAVARIALVKPDKAKGVENMVLQMAQRGQLTEKV